jgi:hypothetical protein
MERERERERAHMLDPNDTAITIKTRINKHPLESYKMGAWRELGEIKSA